jgi:hypothetical protein
MPGAGAITAPRDRLALVASIIRADSAAAREWLGRSRNKRSQGGAERVVEVKRGLARRAQRPVMGLEHPLPWAQGAGRTSECKVRMARVRGRLAVVLQEQVMAHASACIDRGLDPDPAQHGRNGIHLSVAVNECGMDRV